MFRAWKVARIADIDIYLHGTFLLLLGWVGLSGLAQQEGLGLLLHLLTPLMVFGIVVLHEYGHALAARRFGIPTHAITLYPIGGVARLLGAPRNWKQELVVAGAGPAVNLVLAALGWALFPWVASPLGALLLYQFIFFNLGLLLFNLLPAYPMDGGRILKALLSSRGDALGATRTAVRIGRVLAVGLALWGLCSWQLTLVLIAAFVWISGTAELAQARIKSWMERPSQRFDPQVIEAEYYVVQQRH